MSPEEAAKGGGGLRRNLKDLFAAGLLVALVATVAVPWTEGVRSRRAERAAIADLHELRAALIAFAAERGRFPLAGSEMDTATLSPLVPDFLATGRLATTLRGGHLDWYLPWNFIDTPAPPTGLAGAQGFTAFATLGDRSERQFYVTDRGVFGYAGGRLAEVRP